MVTDPHTDSPIAGRLPAQALPMFSAARLSVAALLLLLLSLIIKSAWLGDDFYIGVRSFENLLNGYGLRWNVVERVQVFTDPFWYFILTAFYAVTGEVFVTTIVLSIIVSMAAVVLVVRYSASTSMAAVAALLALISSRAFVDYTTSGLENTLSYFLTALFCLAYTKQPIGRPMLRQVVLLSCLVGFNRLDLMLMLFPAVAYVFWTVLWKQRAPFWPIIGDAVLFSLPVSGWLAFSVIYFGYPFPNTYYAKLHTGIPGGEQLVQGLLYYLSALNTDPETLLVLALTTATLAFSREPRFRTVAAGVVLYLLYVVKIGGDFMAGRFFSVPLFFALAHFVQLRATVKAWAAFGLFAVAIGLLAVRPTLFYNESFPSPAENLGDHRGIADERAFYYPEVGLGPVLRHDRFEPTHGWAQWGREARARGKQMVIFGTPGMYAYYAGPDVHVVDYYALGDPLLSKLPITSARSWRVGHYARAIPNGYVESIRDGENRIEDPSVRELYRITTLLAQGPIFSGERWAEIVKMNLGYYKPLMRRAAKSKRSTQPPPDGVMPTSLPFVERHIVAGRPVQATVSAKWARETNGTTLFSWTDKEARIEFRLHEEATGEGAMTIPIDRFVPDTPLQFVVNGEPVQAEITGPMNGAHFAPFTIRASWKAGKNVVEIIGAGEAVNPPNGDSRKMLFAVGEPVWQ